MRRIPKKLREEMNSDPFYHKCVCAGDNFGCAGKIEFHHVFLWAGRQINEKWNILPVCEFHHRGLGFDKEYFEWIAVNRATNEELVKYPRINWAQIRSYLNSQYGNYAN